MDQSAAMGVPAPASAAVFSAPPGGRLRGLRLHLVGLVLAVLLPALGFGGAACWTALRSYRSAAEARLIDSARALASVIDSEIAARRAALQVLAASSYLDRAGDLAAFDSLARNVGTAFGGWVTVLDRSLRPVIHTLVPPGGPVPGSGGGIGPGGGGVAIARVLETGQPTVSDLATGRNSGRLSAFVFVPALRDGEVQHVVGMPILPEHLARLLRGQVLSGHGAIAITDRRGVLVAHSEDHERLIGQQRPPRGDQEPRQVTGLLTGRRLIDGKPIRTAYHQLATAPGWTLWVNEPETTFLEAWFSPMVALLGGGLLALCFGLLLAVGLSRRVLRPVHALVRHAERIAAGLPPEDRPLPQPKAAVAEFEALRMAGLRAEAALRRGDARLRLALEAAGLGSFEIDLRDRTATRTGHVLPARLGLPLDGFSLERYLADVVHPEDSSRVGTAVEAVATGASEHYRVEYRARNREGAWIWMESYGAVVERDVASGLPLRIAGVARDVTERKAAEARQWLLMREVDHRAKNALAVVQAAVRLAPKQDAAAFAAAVEGRVTALARVQGLLAETGWSGTALRTLAERSLAAFLPAGAVQGPACTLAGPAVELTAAATQPLSLVLHELATNAAKYGALSLPGGRLSLSWQPDQAAGLLRLRWEERGGPPLARLPERSGFGSRVIRASIEDQLHGQVMQAWEAEGLVCHISLPLTHLRPLASEATNLAVVP
ncbi:HWE histidine kinase domain-containing protein [Belnapia sp. F-4-1]|uniref:HWE histidine kinase domain-containing protein n=1 Tax=Belnapia sp. F-4-1 TaxID=1545443 RepID=UPI00068C4DAD|nr:HWE histidine kinase domain-containing protein [Belnapia sp. F-4-1]